MYSHQPPPAHAPAPRRGHRAVLLTALGGGIVAVAAVGTLFAAGILDGGENGAVEPGKSALAEPDEPSVNPDDTHYAVAEKLCSRLDVSGYEAIAPAESDMSEEAEDDPYGQGNFEVECEQRYMVEKDDGSAAKYAMLTVKVSSFPTTLRARHEGYSDYSDNMLDDVESEPEWREGDWEKAQVAVLADDETAAAAIVLQDDNLTLGVSLYATDSGLDAAQSAELVQGTATELIGLCEK